MKKTLVALAVTAFAASASAVTVYENEGTNVVVDGRVNVFVKKDATKVKDQKTTDESNLVNNGSRLGVTVKHNITEDFYGIGRVEFRFNGKDSSSLDVNEKGEQVIVQTQGTGTAGWGGIRAHRAYVGLGGAGHQVTFGKQLVIGDDIGLVGFDNYYAVGSDDTSLKGHESILTTSADSAVHYTYTGVKGLKLGAHYNFATSHDDGEAIKNGYGLGAIYTFDVADGQALTASAGYSHNDYETGADVKKNKDGMYFGLAYDVNSLTVGVDGGRAVTKTGDVKKKVSFVRAGAKYGYNDKGAVYGNYGYTVIKNGDDPKGRSHQFMLGTEYKLHKLVKVYLEGKIDKVKPSNATKYTDKGIGAGLAVYW